VLIPFPGAVDDHQTRNAAFLVDARAAVLVPQAELTAERLAAEIARYQADRALVMEQARRARSLARPNATEELASVCQRLGEAA
jgi:UDP-N-acetylglucosamine--N-acetylmuramyl-(pentapeptide) pyrophosphoryl-undecaprenol N-acetylglucosamine transferase